MSGGRRWIRRRVRRRFETLSEDSCVNDVWLVYSCVMPQLLECDAAIAVHISLYLGSVEL